MLTTTPADLTSVAHQMLSRLEQAWNAGDGAAFGACYASDASFVTVRGDRIVGSAAIGAGHDGIFRSIYAGSVNRMELIETRPLAEGVVLVVSLNTLDVPAGPFAGRHQAFSTNVITRAADGAWSILSTHNTLVAA
jgi:uncharacterized protein (TIGR02246 family)